MGDYFFSGANWRVEQADAVTFLRSQAAGSLDLVIFSPPYEKARLYLEGGKDMGIARGTEAWVAWMLEVFDAALFACKGLVAAVVEGQTKNYRYSAAPFLLMADLARKGVCLRKPPVYRRVGIPGSGGPDWWRNDWEPIICATNGGKLPWSDNTATGHPPKWAPGGEMSHRLSDGARVNQWGGRKSSCATRRDSGVRQKAGRPSHEFHQPNGTKEQQHYNPPALANPGNVITCVVGGGQMGNDLASENEAPFPESLVEPFVRCFCPEGGTVCDPFAGSSTTGAVALKWGRRFVGCDLRKSQVELSARRLKGEATLFDGVTP